VSSYQALVRFANTGDDQRTAVADGLRDALSATPTSRPWRSISQQLVLGIVDELLAHVDVRSLRFVRARTVPIPETGGDVRWDFDDEIDTTPVNEARSALLHAAASAPASRQRRRVHPKAPPLSSRPLMHRPLQLGSRWRRARASPSSPPAWGHRGAGGGMAAVWPALAAVESSLLL